MSSSAKQEVLAATRDSLPIWIGVTPFGLVFGLLGRQTELGVAGTLAMSAIVFAGSAQFISLGLLQAGTPYPLIILTTLVVNLRHMLYGASLAPHLQRLPAGWQRFLAFGLTDESYALTVTRYARPDGAEHRHWYFLAANANMFVCWQLSTAAGILLSNWVPDPAVLGLDFALSATFIGLMIPHVRDRSALVAIAVAGTVALLARGLPGQLGLLLAALLAATAGLLWDRVDGSWRRKVAASVQAHDPPPPVGDDGETGP
ncbi:MAG TPA: AzlC family ABC transporter permease [Anaerolineae bacterium]|nr:AzlC family ABC transporter permease [Anaerolineae bacterium]